MRERHEEESGGGFEVPEEGGENCRKCQGKDLTLEFLGIKAN